jgi:hypothetical protein
MSVRRGEMGRNKNDLTKVMVHRRCWDGGEYVKGRIQQEKRRKQDVLYKARWGRCVQVRIYGVQGRNVRKSKYHSQGARTTGARMSAVPRATLASLSW